MMNLRQVVLDTETTGLEVSKGHRVIEIGCIELVERRPTGRTFHRYLNPGRAIDVGALEVTGLTLEFLADKPVFSAVAEDFIAFVADAELIIHNAAFDVGFLDQELTLCNARVRRLIDCARVTDTLAMARERFPGQRNSLDALCRRFGVDNAHRKLHGALLDAELLAEVYLAMTAGQGALAFESAVAETVAAAGVALRAAAAHRLLVRHADAAELIEHAKTVERLRERSGDRCLWLQLPPADDIAVDVDEVRRAGQAAPA